MKNPRSSCLMLAAIAAFVSTPAAAQPRPAAADYPNRVVRIILPQPAGGGTDFVARTIALKLTEAWGQQVIVDNRPGANGIIGGEAVARSKPDGYTYLYGFTSMLTINPSVYKSLPYDTLRDFAPVTQTVMNQIVLVVNPYLPARTVKELFALGRSRPGELVYGSFGIGNQTHLTAELFRLEAKLKMLHVPYKGETPAITELVSGQVALMFSPSAGVTPHVRAGRLRLLAVCGEKRAAVFPDTPTMIESGFPGVISTGWGAMLAPAGTPRDIIQKAQREIARGLAMADVRERLGTIGADAIGSTPEEFGAWLKSETEKWTRVVRGANLFHSQ
ncbi:MAG TPA: tripartite tricarboxylate transporter substrate binding protein [Burkholderiales bacterium]|nr:tripartite tricarboxylate transporter substrate binding protein [Burkholderiales bacterium]